MATNNLGEDLRLLLAAVSARRAEDGLAAAVRGVTGASGSGAVSIPADAAGSLAGELSALRAQVADLRIVGASQVESLERNTQVTAENTQARNRGAGETVSRVADSVRRTAGIGLSASPLIGGLIRLFSRPKTAEQPVLPQFEAASPVQLEAALPVSNGDNFAPVRRDLAGAVSRVTEQPAAAAPAVTIQVNAIDSRSFLDHSEEITRAVRQAVLSAQGLNDVLAER